MITFKKRSFIRAKTASRTPAKTISRTIVLDNPKKSLVLWDKIVLKEVTAGHGALSI
jgi:hypothetical protein